MPVPIQYQGYTNKPPKKAVPAYDPAKRVAKEYQAPSPAFRVMQEYRMPTYSPGIQTLLRNAQATAYMGGAPLTSRVFNVPGGPQFSPRQYFAQAQPPAINSPAMLTKRYTHPTQEQFTYVNIPRIQGPPISMAGGNTGMLPAWKSNLLEASRRQRFYDSWGGYGGGGGGYTQTPQAGFVRPAPRLNQAAAPFVGQRAPFPQEYAASPGREVMGIPAPQRLLPRWYRNLTSWRV